MFRYVSLLRDRFTLRINEEQYEFHYYNELNKCWDKVGNQVIASSSAVIKGSLMGRKIKLASRFNVGQSIIVVHMGRRQAVGSILVTVEGALSVSAQPTTRFDPDFGVPQQWLHVTTVILGVQEACTLNIRDIIAEDEDIIRLKPREERWFVPARYTSATIGYDDQVTEKQTMSRVEQSGSIGLRTGQGAKLIIIEDETTSSEQSASNATTVSATGTNETGTPSLEQSTSNVATVLTIDITETGAVGSERKDEPAKKEDEEDAISAKATDAKESDNGEEEK